MVRKTHNHGLHVYERGDTDWTHAPDMETIERRLVVRGERAALDSYDPHDGATFVATDTGAVFDGDGDSWSRATRRYAETTVDDLRTRETPVADVRAYGATGDGESDDTEAIRSAIDTDGAAVAYLPKGTYRVTDELSLDSTNLRGDGAGATTIALDERVDRALAVDGAGGGVADLTVECNGMAMEGVRLAAEHALAERVAVDHVTQWGDRDESTACINVMSAPHATVESCRATRARAPNTGVSNGIHVAGDGGGVTIRNCAVDDVTPKADGDGIVVQGLNDGTRVIGNHVTNAAKSALKLNRPTERPISVLATGNTLQAGSNCLSIARIQGTETTFAGNTLVQDRVADAALRVSTDPDLDAAPVTVTGNVIELTDPADGNDLIRIRDWDRGVVVSGNTCKLYGGGNCGIRADSSENVVIEGNALDQVGETAISLVGTSLASVTGNVVDDAGTAGISLDAEASRCVVTGNVVDAPDGITVADGAADVAVGTNVGG
ncbi:right-handed parallel beta-helix repeat-containing protein [Halovivax cerinus]|uniref:Right-handed parallel beta-helix repeat-containing protein n=1 Tax=Halovivax cerinus TaxID=1487865 RepID=A0ABD5NP30_9EURY|nr:right-handed parallel beta-helix repeat-containing protein [Halovivax cerinus]